MRRSIYRTNRPRRPGIARRSPAMRGGYIDPNKFINKAEAPVEAEVFNATHTFADFGLKPEIQRNVAAKGYLTPTPVQDQSIKPILAGRDLIGLANTGTGKTGAFLLPIIQQLLDSPTRGAVLIVVPTRELAVQIS